MLLMKPILAVLLFLPVFAIAQKLKKADKAILESLKTNIAYLSDDKLEGRRAGTNGEVLAVTFITDDTDEGSQIPFAICSAPAHFRLYSSEETFR